MAMRRTTLDGKRLNVRTADMIRRARARSGLPLFLMQGSYNSGVGASAGTHDGGGAADFSVRGYTAKQKAEAVLQLRKVGFAAWHRPAISGLWPEHIHAIAIGDSEMSSGARQQVSAYYNRRNGLANNGPDNGPRLDPIPTWPMKLPRISLSNAAQQFRTEGTPRKVLAVKRIQSLLNRRLGTDLVVDGIAGPKTRAAYKRWEQKIGVDKPNSSPGGYSLKKLAAGFFQVIK